MNNRPQLVEAGIIRTHVSAGISARLAKVYLSLSAVIEELEPDSRSIYTGSLGYFSFHNTLEFNVLIRSFLKKGDEISFSVGGGIVTDSIPEDEYEETLIKSKALTEALTHV